MAEVSVIMTSRDKFPLIRRAVESVRQQTFKDWELIIVDDDSQDPKVHRYLKKIESSKIRVMRCSPVTEEFRALHKMNLVRLNAAMDTMVRGEFIAYIGDDNQWFPRHLESCMQAFRTAPIETKVVYDQVQWINYNGQKFDQEMLRYRYEVHEDPWHTRLMEMIQPDTYMCHDCVVHRKVPRCCFKYETRKDSKIPQDWAMWLEFVKHNHNVARVQSVGALAVYPGTWRGGITVEQVAGSVGQILPIEEIERRKIMVNKKKIRERRERAEGEVQPKPVRRWAVNTSGKKQQITNVCGGAPLFVPVDGRVPVDQVMTEKGLFPGFSYETREDTPPLQEVLAKKPSASGDIKYSKVGPGKEPMRVEPKNIPLPDEEPIASPFDEDLKDDGEAFEDLPGEPVDSPFEEFLSCPDDQEAFDDLQDPDDDDQEPGPYCRGCGTPIGKRNKSGLCRTCYNESRRRR